MFQRDDPSHPPEGGLGEIDERGLGSNLLGTTGDENETTRLARGIANHFLEQMQRADASVLERQFRRAVGQPVYRTPRRSRGSPGRRRSRRLKERPRPSAARRPLYYRVRARTCRRRGRRYWLPERATAHVSPRARSASASSSPIPIESARTSQCCAVRPVLSLVGARANNTVGPNGVPSHAAPIAVPCSNPRDRSKSCHVTADSNG